MRRADAPGLAEDLLVDAGPMGEVLDVPVAGDRVADLAQQRHHGVDEPAPALRRANVVQAGVVVDEVDHHLDWRPIGPVPCLGRLADHLVGVLAFGQADDPGVHPGFGLLHLGEQGHQLAHAEAAGALAGGIDVVRQCDLQLVSPSRTC